MTSDNNNLPTWVRKRFLTAVVATTAAERKVAAVLLCRYPGLATLADVTGLLNYYPMVGQPLPDPYLQPEQQARQFIDAALERCGWSGLKVRREWSFQSTTTQRRLRADYVLYIFVSRLQKRLPVALIEAESQSYVAADGLLQAQNYADQFPENTSLRFVFATNGISFVRYDRLRRRTQQAEPIGEFPPPRSLARGIRY